MGKGYEILNYTEFVSIDEIENLFDGYWVYLTNARYTETHGLLGGIPVIKADTPYAGGEHGIYRKYTENDDYSPCVGISFIYDEFVSLFLDRAGAVSG